jgi:hypothetical protein
MTPTSGKWNPISTVASNTASVNILNGVTVPANAKAMVVTFDSDARISIGVTDASGSFGHLIPGMTPFFIDSLHKYAEVSDWVTACANAGALPPAGHITFYEVVSNI